MGESLCTSSCEDGLIGSHGAQVYHACPAYNLMSVGRSAQGSFAMMDHNHVLKATNILDEVAFQQLE